MDIGFKMYHTTSYLRHKRILKLTNRTNALAPTPFHYAFFNKKSAQNSSKQSSEKLFSIFSLGSSLEFFHYLKSKSQQPRQHRFNSFRELFVTLVKALGIESVILIISLQCFNLFHPDESTPKLSNNTSAVYCRRAAPPR